MTDFNVPLTAFDHALSLATSRAAAFDALLALTRATVGVKLFTYDRWFKIVHTDRECFVANTLADIAAVFPDFELIGQLGCGSVIYLPLVLGDTLVGTVNMLHEEDHYTAERVAQAKVWLSVPAKAAYLAGHPHQHVA